MKFIIFLLLITSATSFAYDSRYKSEAEIPEPLLFDLVRRINSDRGELEINTLFTHTHAEKIKGVHAAPEIEYAFADGMAVELELPTVNGKVETYKGALQFQLPSWIGDLTGTQLMHEKFAEDSVHETTVLLLSAKRLSEKWSVFTMIGNRFVYGDSDSIRNRRMRELPIFNLNLFYDFADVFDLGLETNVRGMGASFEELIVMPQIHALLTHDFKIQMGFGVSYDGYDYSPISAFRFIKEFNYGP